eukprot:scaffold153631_cov18-Tisochrysis_lutea.AAC.1
MLGKRREDANMCSNSFLNITHTTQVQSEECSAQGVVCMHNSSIPVKGKPSILSHPCMSCIISLAIKRLQKTGMGHVRDWEELYAFTRGFFQH